MAGPTIVYLAAGELHVLTDGGERSFASRFAEQVRERSLSIQRRNAWKSQGRGAMFAGTWQPQGSDAHFMPVQLPGLCRGRTDGEVLYALATPDVGGVFAVELADGEEQRLFHSADRRVRELSYGPDREAVVCSVSYDPLSSDLALMNPDGTRLRPITEGDSIDGAPSWVHGAPRAVVYQSAGVARDAAGQPRGRGPFGIQRLDLEAGTVDDLLQDEAHDLLAPQVASDGALLFVRRPWKQPGQASLGGCLKEALLFPFHVIYAAFQWLNFFTIRHTGKPLTTAGGPERQAKHIERLMLWGMMVDAEQAAKESQRAGDEVPAMVPQSWHLVRRAPDGAEEIIARGVAAFDVAPDGALVWSNGRGLWHRAPGSSEVTEVGRGEGIERVLLVG